MHIFIKENYSGKKLLIYYLLTNWKWIKNEVQINAEIGSEDDMLRIEMYNKRYQWKKLCKAAVIFREIQKLFYLTLKHTRINDDWNTYEIKKVFY